MECVFAERLAFYRKKRGLLQRELAEALGTGVATVSGWELGNFTPKLSVIYEICDVLEISVSELLERDTAKSSTYSPEEQAIIEAYRKHPEMHRGVKALLEVE